MDNHGPSKPKGDPRVNNILVSQVQFDLIIVYPNILYINQKLG